MPASSTSPQRSATRGGLSSLSPTGRKILAKKQQKKASEKPGMESIFVGPALLTLLSGAVLITAMAFDRWYTTSHRSDISRYGLFKTCVGTKSECETNEFDSFVQTPSCRGSASTWQARSIATAVLMALGLLGLLAAFCVNVAAAFSRNMVYFFWSMVFVWLALCTIAAGGGVQYHFFSLVLFCDLSYCDYSLERYSDMTNCSQAFGMSSFLWFVGLVMVVCNAIGSSVLTVLWRDRLSLTWEMMKAEQPAATAAHAPTMNNNGSSALRRANSSSRLGTPRNNNTSNAREPTSPQVSIAQPPAQNLFVPEGFLFDSESGYYYSSRLDLYYDAPSRMFYDASRGMWFDGTEWN